MKSFYFFRNCMFRIAALAIAIFLFNSQAGAQLSGTYTISNDSVGAHFKTFAEVADTLNATTGIDGPVVFKVLPGIHDCHITLGAIVGSSGTNTITFQGSTGDSTKSIINYNYTSNSADNYMIRLNGTDYVTFKSLTFDATSGNANYCKVFDLLSAPTYINVQNNVFHGKYRSYYDDGTLIYAYHNNAEYFIIENNVFNQGEKAVHFNYNSTYSRGNIVRNNECIDQASRAIELRNQNAPKINGNYIYNGSAGALYGILLDNASNSYEVMNNSVRIYDPTDGIALEDCDGGASLKGKVYNNFVSMWGSARDNYGMRITNSDYVQVYHNTVYHSSGWRTTSKTFYQTGGGNIDIRNNIFSNMGGGYPYYINTTGAITTSD